MILQPQPESPPWWNRPLFGKITLLQRLLGMLNRKSLPELTLSLHNTELEELIKISSILQMLDNDQFNHEFLSYISIKNQIENNKGDYKGLQTFIKILRFAIEKYNHFSILKRIELDYQGKSQLELYDFIFEQLNNNLDKSVFLKNVSDKIEDLISIIRNEPTKQALECYIHSLNAIAKNQIGLSLLLLFKKYNFADYTFFNIIFDILKQLKQENLSNLKVLVLIVKVNFKNLENLGKVMGIPIQNNEPITHAKILQYIAMCYKYENLNYRFHQLIDNLIKWEKHYKTLLEIRKEYPRYKYYLPEDFMKFIPGENIYQKYQNHLFLNEITIHDQFLE